MTPMQAIVNKLDMMLVAYFFVQSRPVKAAKLSVVFQTPPKAIVATVRDDEHHIGLFMAS